MRELAFILFISIFSFKVEAQDYSKWSPGCYYDLTNNKICGEIKWDIPSRSIFKAAGDYFLFKTADTAKKQKIRNTDFRAFVMQGDSFVVSHDTSINDYPILKVIVDNFSHNPLKLYSCLRINSSHGSYAVISSLDVRYFYGGNPDQLTELDRSNFIEVMSKIVADDDELVAAIKNKTYRYGKLDAILEKYRAFKQH